MRTAALAARIILWLVVPNAVSSVSRGDHDHHDYRLQQQFSSTRSTSTSRPHVPTNGGINTFRHISKRPTAQTLQTTTHLTTSIRDVITKGVPIALLSHSRTPIEEQSTTQTEDDRASLLHNTDDPTPGVFHQSTASPDTTDSQSDVVLNRPESVQTHGDDEDELMENVNNDVLHNSDVNVQSTADRYIQSRRESPFVHSTTHRVATPEAGDGTLRDVTLFPAQREDTTKSLTREFVPGDSELEYDSFKPDSIPHSIVKKVGGAIPTEKQTVPETTGPLQTEPSAPASTLKTTGTSPEATSATTSRTVLPTALPPLIVPTEESRPIKVHKKSDTLTAGGKEREGTLPVTVFETASEERVTTVPQHDAKFSSEDTVQGTEGTVETTTARPTTDSHYVHTAIVDHSDLPTSPTSAASTASTTSPESTTGITDDTTGVQDSLPVNPPRVKVDEERPDPIDAEGKFVPKTTQERSRIRGQPADIPGHPPMPTDNPSVIEPEEDVVTEVSKGKSGKQHGSGSDVTEAPKELFTTTVESTVVTEASGSAIETSSVPARVTDATESGYMTSESPTVVRFSEGSAFTAGSTDTTTVFDDMTQIEQTTEAHGQADCLRLQTGCTAPNSTEDTSNATSSAEASVPAKNLPDVSFCITVTLSGTWDRFCREIEEFRRSIADVLSLELRPDISPKQIVIEDNCSQNRRKQDRVVVRMHLTDTEDRYSQKLTTLAAVVLHHNDRQHINLQMMNVCFYSSKSVTSTSKKSHLGMSSTGVIASITISAIAGTSLFLISVLLVVMRQRIQNTRGAPTTADALSLASFKSSFRKKKIRQSLRSFLNEAFDDNEDFSKPVPFNSLPAVLSNKDALEEEFKRIPMNMARVDDLPPGVECKNRYANVIPISETKVLLSSRPDDDTSDYINANFVRGYKGRPQRYIACQAPLPETTEDFWRMIWEQQCKVIMMLTACEENGVQRCAPYFPVNTLDCHKLYGDYQVTLQSKDVRPSFTFSTFKLHHLDKNLCREVHHCWYTAWPPQGVPEDVSSVVTFLLEARQYTSRSSAPIVVHCSPGTGRTGAVLAIDICMQELADKHRVDVPRTVFRLRQDRGGAVQTKDQYAFVYEALYDCSARLAAQSQRPSVISTT